MKLSFKNGLYGYTIVELLVIVLIVAFLATTLGMFFVNLLTIQENEREDAYIREKLVDICGMYADYASVGESFQTNSQITLVKYREETGGVSLETGRVSRVTRLMTSNGNADAINANKPNFEIGSIEWNEDKLTFISKISRFLRGDAELIPLVGNKVICSITPLNFNVTRPVGDDYFGNLQTTDAALAYLQVVSEYKVKNDEGKYESKTVKVGRIVRLWNRE